MKIFKEFKDFAMKGNVLDLAVALIIGGAFGKIVTSFVNDVLMPPVGLLLGNTDFINLKIVLKAATEQTEAVTLKYGVFINTILDFIIVSFSIFMVVKVFNKLKKKEVAPPSEPPAPTKEEVLLSEIRDILKEKK
ncbi:MAG: large-conductance mechanosensitive channel protein MscL [Bacteroidales bacterium]|jgi:large conductance mechanosensitive channel|nr:large-conductance mechanosensitive channel protein MscL [Bacteroidales bacterium]